MELNINNISKGKIGEYKNTIPCTYTHGNWKQTSLPPDTSIVQISDGTKVYKMNTHFGISPSNLKDKSKCSSKSKPGDFLLLHEDGSLTTLSKLEYSKFFPKQPYVSTSKAVSSKVLRNKDFITNLKKKQ